MKIYTKIWELIPILWGMLWLAIITVGSAAALVFIVKLFLNLVGVA
jgi:hypothetical protein